jgi:hypothetical protein
MTGDGLRHSGVSWTILDKVIARDIILEDDLEMCQLAPAEAKN